MDFENEQTRLLRMIEYAGEKGLINVDDELLQSISDGKRIENQYILDLSVHNHAQQPLYDAAETVHADIDVNTATGEALDRLGRLVGVTRFPAMPGTVDVVVDIGEGFMTEDITIPAGTLVLCDGLDSSFGEYQTDETVVINVGTSTMTIRCSCTDYGVVQPLPVGSVTRLNGFDLQVSNPEHGTSGRNIEEDEDYRQRIRNATTANTVGTRAYLESYLGMYEGLDGYTLVPRYDGVGTLKIVCDTTTANLEQIRDDVYANCMSLTDVPPLCVLPTDHNLQSLTVTVLVGDICTLTREELSQIIESQVHTFVEGGYTREGIRRPGYVIGRDFYPSALLGYLVSSFPELSNIRLNLVEPVTIASDEKVALDTVTVVFE